VSYCLCVYCAASDEIDDIYFRQAAELGAEMASRGHRLVYGGGLRGLMGAVARSVQAGGGNVVGVIPERLDRVEVTYTDADEMIYTLTMRERKAIMEQRADAFIALPGGIGTLEELLEIITLKSLGYHNKPIVILDGHGYYEPLLQMLEQTISGGFARPTLREVYYVAESIADALDHIEASLRTNSDPGATR